jgi:hypothetical protein
MIFCLCEDIMIASDIGFFEGWIIITHKHAILQEKIIVKYINEFGVHRIIDCNGTVFHGMEVLEN